MKSYHFAPRLAAVWPIAALALACAGPGPQVIATYRGGELALADLDQHVRALPEARRTVPEGVGRDAWLEELIRGLALQRSLAASDGVAEQLASDAVAARRRWAIAGLLAAAVMQELATAAAPGEDAVAERLAAIGEPEPQQRYNFRHVFLRLDRVADPADKRAIRDLAADVARRARAGEDFAELARRHSQSVTARDGGLVENQRPELLEAGAHRAIVALAEGEVSGVVETRTGLHVFRLERLLTLPPPGLEQRRTQARRILAREALAQQRAALLDDLRQRVEVAAGDLPWRVGSVRVTGEDLAAMASGSGAEPPRDTVVEQLLLAEEGRRRGLLTPELEAQVDHRLRQEAIQATFLERREEYLAALPEARLRPIYDAFPSGFATPESAHLDLIFVPDGRDAFATQRRLEDHVGKLRAGASFADLARRISTGPAADAGGDLGVLPAGEWARLGPQIYNTVLTLEPGAISDPIHLTGRILTPEARTLRGGFAILRVRRKTPPRERTFEEAIGAVRAAYARQHVREVDEGLRAQLLAEADFEIVRLPGPDELLQ